MNHTNIHNSDEIIPDVHHSNDGRGWITFTVKRKNWYDGKEMEAVEVTIMMRTAWAEATTAPSAPAR